MNRRRFFQSLMSACVALPVTAVASKLLLIEPERQDAAARLDQYTTSGSTKGWLTVNKVRAMEDLPPIEDQEFLEAREFTALEIRRIFDVCLSTTERRRLMPSRFHRF